MLEQGLSARTVELEKEDRKLVADLNLLTDKPVLYVCNVDEKSAVTGNAYTEAVKRAIADEKAEMLVIAAATEPTSPNSRATRSARCSSRTWASRSRAWPG